MSWGENTKTHYWLIDGYIWVLDAVHRLTHDTREESCSELLSLVLHTRTRHAAWRSRWIPRSCRYLIISPSVVRVARNDVGSGGAWGNGTKQKTRTYTFVVPKNERWACGEGLRWGPCMLKWLLGSIPFTFSHNLPYGWLTSIGQRQHSLICKEDFHSFYVHSWNISSASLVYLPASGEYIGCRGK